MTEKKTAKQSIKPKARSTTMLQIETKANPIAMHDLLGEKLRAYYDLVSNEPVPQRFENLLKQLELKSKPTPSE